MSLFGVDISSNDGNIDIYYLKNVDFIITKLSQGVSYINDYFDDYRKQTYSVGKKFGVYHYASTNNPESEAEYFVNCLKEKKVNATCFLDIEHNCNMSYGEYASRFDNWFNKLTGKHVIVYTYASACSDFGNTKPNFPLWVACIPKDGMIYDYKPYLNMEIPYSIEPWNNCAIWQFSWTYVINNHLYDANICYDDNLFDNPEYKIDIGEDYYKYLNAAYDVINGKYGNGNERKKNLEKDGYDYNRVQGIINSIYRVAFDVIDGKYGNGKYRREKLLHLGWNYDIIQNIVDELLKEMRGFSTK